MDYRPPVELLTHYVSLVVHGAGRGATVDAGILFGSGSWVAAIWDALVAKLQRKALEVAFVCPSAGRARVVTALGTKSDTLTQACPMRKVL